MNGSAMKTLISKSSFPRMAVLFVIGVATGILMFYGYQLRERSTHVLANAPPPTQQPAPMPDMPNMPATGTQTPKPQEAGPMPGMPEQNTSAKTAQGSQSAAAATGQTMAPGTVMLDPASQQLIGVRYTEARRTDMKRTLRTVGLVQMDDQKISRVHVKFAGWIDKVYLDYVGKLIKKGQPLFTLYSPDLVSSQQEYLIALKSQEYLSKAPYADAASGADSLLRATRDRLQLLDITDAQIRALEETGKAQRTMTVYSPISGFVMNRNAFEQAYVTPETALYDIADLSTIWVYVDIYEYEAPFVRIGQLGSMQLSYFPGKTYTGRVTYVYPTLDPKTRTIKVRLEFPNPKYELKPEMYADVQVAIDYGSQIVVPSEAVLNSGTGQFVFIAKPGGYFEPRQIKVGDQFDGQYVVLAGLKPGEKIVASGNFLIDSESRLGSAMQGMAGMQGKPPAKK
jgi:Cu(I)/Ag(I) efflux system membrane fusion protein